MLLRPCEFGQDSIATDSAPGWLGNKVHLWALFLGVEWGKVCRRQNMDTRCLEVCGSEKDLFSIYSRSTHSWLLLLLPGCQRSQNQQASRKKREYPCISSISLSKQNNQKQLYPISSLCSAGTLEDSRVPSLPPRYHIVGNHANRALSHHPFSKSCILNARS